MKSYSRRKFLKGAATAGAALSTTSILHGEAFNTIIDTLSVVPQTKQ